MNKENNWDIKWKKGMKVKTPKTFYISNIANQIGKVVKVYSTYIDVLFPSNEVHPFYYDEVTVVQ